MAPYNGLQLSLELTKLIPLAVEGSMSFARGMQGSGSDIVVEADLAELFGRCLIEAQMASTFKSVISRTSSSKLCEGISLESGPGPTTLRALKPEHAVYFATVIQCSLLAYVMDRESLAEILKSIFDKRVEEAPPHAQIRASPSAAGISGFLRVCEDQTAEYEWNKLLLTISTILDMPDMESSEPIPRSILAGLVSTLALVQRFPEEHNIQIECSSGTCLIVVWAHYVLGMSVLVDAISGSKQTPFGPEPYHIIIDTMVVKNNKLVEPTLTLLACTKDNSQEPLFQIRSDDDEARPDELKIDSIYRTPAAGYGHQTLSRSASNKTFFSEMMNVTCAFAMLIAGHLRAELRIPANKHDNDEQEETDSDGSASAEPEEPREGDRIILDGSDILRAGEFLFGKKLNEGAIKDYVALYKGQSLNQELQRPQIIEAWNKASTLNYFANAEHWKNQTKMAQYLSILILAFAHVQDLASCSGIMLNGNCSTIRNAHIAQQVRGWDGNRSIKVTARTWFNVIASILDHDLPDVRGIALLSNRGWSIYFTTFGLQPPFDVSADSLIIRKGVPYRNGMYRHAVADGWDQGRQEEFDWQRINSAGDKIRLSCANDVVLGRAMYGEHRDTFIVSLRMIYQDRDTTCIRRVGYYELYSALWMVQKTTSCNHSSQSQSEVVLPSGSLTISGFNDFELPDYHERLRVCMTANQDIARWRVLLAIVSGRRQAGQKDEYVMLRGDDCCLKCALDQASLRPNPCILVL
ncbi:hypothetical protein VTL71DRAFT_8888 [Oculimacula yallundae]|uniref:Uncharacterized protein n=1 Tax=Oculimacula yallundae TaxID=86028 RepID=A0ABR4BT68_9HELO